MTIANASPDAFVVASFYRFAPLAEPLAHKPALEALCRKQGLRGILLLAHEGINGTVTGSAEAVSALHRHLLAWPEIDSLEWKTATADRHGFRRLKIRLKAEIVTMGQPDISPSQDSGTYVEPADWNSLISRDDIMLIDTRNRYETRLGQFTGAVDPQTDHFRQFPAWAEQLAGTPNKPRAVAMYCTGGIRCEKATAYMRRLGFAEVYHLKGGILRYLEEIPTSESRWQGECFVFDERVSVDHALEPGSYRLCHGCKSPLAEAEQSGPGYEPGVSCRYCHDLLTVSQRQRFRERQHQLQLARQRGSRHFAED